MLLVSAYLYWNRIVIGFQAKTVSSSWSSLTLGFILYHLSLFSNRSHFGPTCELINYLVKLGWFFFSLKEIVSYFTLAICFYSKALHTHGNIFIIEFYISWSSWPARNQGVLPLSAMADPLRVLQTELEGAGSRNTVHF